MTKAELREFCAMHYRMAVAREAQGKDFILRARAGARTAGKDKHREWNRDEAERRTFGAVHKKNPHTCKRWADV